MASSKDLNFTFEFMKDTSYVIDDGFYDHPIQYIFEVKNPSNKLHRGQSYSLDLVMKNTSSTKFITGKMIFTITTSRGLMETGDLQYHVAPGNTILLKNIKKAKYNRDIITVNISFQEGPLSSASNLNLNLVQS